MRSRFIYTISSVAAKPNCSATASNEESILTSIPGPITPVPKLLSNSKLGDALHAYSFSSRQTQATRPRALPQLCDRRKTHPRPPGPSLSLCFRNIWSGDSVFAMLEFGLHNARYITLKKKCFDLIKWRKCDCFCLRNVETGREWINRLFPKLSCAVNTPINVHILNYLLQCSL